MTSLYFKKTNVVNITSSSIHYTRSDGSNLKLLAHIGFKNLEERHAEVVSQNGGHILEVGFGLGCSANKFVNSNIESYTCIEINDTIYQQALNWAQDKPNVTIINGSWEQTFPTLTNQYDGIYYSPLDLNYEQFYNACKPLSKVGTIMSAQGVTLSGIYELTENMNIDQQVQPPHFFDNEFTQHIADGLLMEGYFYVYWQYFNGTNFVKSL
jgi:predicted O-methyltransferase YrrM